MSWLFISAAQAAPAGEGGKVDPMHQFVIERYVPIDIFGYDASFTNSSLWMVMATVLIIGFLVYSMRHGALVPDRLQSAGELTYQFVANIVKENTGEAGMKYFPLIFTIFLFILFLNLLGLVPIPFLGSFTVTSHIIVTFALALLVFLFATGVGIAKNGLGFLKKFAPSGVPLALMPLIIVIEVISYFTRPISLAVRLFANMMAGHTMLKVFGSFVVGLGVLAGWIPLVFMVAIMGLELMVAFLQAYVFAVLTCIYLDDAIHASDH